MMFKFKEGERVALKNDNDALGLMAGETGKIWALYEIQPPAYEVSFSPQDGSEFDALMYEDELREPLAECEPVPLHSEQSLVSVS